MASPELDLASALETLATFRARKSRASLETVEKGTFILEHGGLQKLGNEVWAFIEQLAIAAIDIGQLELADDCITRLAEKFPGSPRVEILQGIRIEATGKLDHAVKFYNDILANDGSNADAWKRLISVLRQQGKIDRAVDELCQFLDTFYTDIEGWLELADMYASCNLYSHSLQALSHAMLLSPQNPFYILQAAETAYTDGDIPLALKFFLRVVEMSEGGLSTRGWHGVKITSQRLLKGPVTSSETEVPSTYDLQLLEELATERLLDCYSGDGEADTDSRAALIKWLENRG